MDTIKQLNEEFYSDIERVLIEKSMFGFLTPSNYKKLPDILSEQIDLFFVELKIPKIKKTIRKTQSPFFNEKSQLSCEFKNSLQEIYNTYSSTDEQRKEKIFGKLKNSFIFLQIAEKIKEEPVDYGKVLQSIENILEIQRVIEFIEILVQQFDNYRKIQSEKIYKIIEEELRLSLNDQKTLRILTPKIYQDLPQTFQQIVKNCYLDDIDTIEVLFSENQKIEEVALQQFYEQYDQNKMHRFLEGVFEKMAFQTKLKQILIIWIIIYKNLQESQSDKTYINDLMNNQDKFIVDAEIIKLIDVILKAKEQQNIQQQQQHLLERDQDELNQLSPYEIIEVYENDSQNQFSCGSSDLYNQSS